MTTPEQRLEAFLQLIREFARQHPGCEPGFAILCSAKGSVFQIHTVTTMAPSLVKILAAELAETPNFELDEDAKRPN